MYSIQYRCKNLQQGNYEWSVEDVYRCCIPNSMVKADGSNLSGDEDIALVNLALSSLFEQCDISLNQCTINTSVGSNYRLSLLYSK